MSASPAILPTAELPGRLRSVSGIEPARLPGLSRLGQRIAAATGAALAEASLAGVEMRLDAVERIDGPTAADESLFPENGLYTLLTGPTFEEPGFLTAAPRLVDAVVSAFFGGERNPGREAARPPTALDRSLVEFAFGALARAVEEGLGELATIEILRGPLVGAVEISRALGEEPPPYVLFRFVLDVGFERDMVSVLLPERLFTPHRRHLAVVPKEEKPASDPAWLRDMESGVSRSSMAVRVVLARQDVSLSRVSRLAVGQTLELSATLESLVDIEIEGQRFFRGHVGRSRDHYVVRVDHQIDPAQEFLDDILSD